MGGGGNAGVQVLVVLVVGVVVVVVASPAVAAGRPHALPFRGVLPRARGWPRLTDSTTVEETAKTVRGLKPGENAE